MKFLSLAAALQSKCYDYQQEEPLGEKTMKQKFNPEKCEDHGDLTNVNLCFFYQINRAVFSFYNMSCLGKNETNFPSTAHAIAIRCIPKPKISNFLKMLVFLQSVDGCGSTVDLFIQLH